MRAGASLQIQSSDSVFRQDFEYSGNTSWNAYTPVPGIYVWIFDRYGVTPWGLWYLATARFSLAWQILTARMDSGAAVRAIFENIFAPGPKARSFKLRKRWHMYSETIAWRRY